MAVSESGLPTLLIVDRDGAARSRLRTQLRGLHPPVALRTVLEAADGAAALAAARGQRIDVVLLDASLPDCSGLDLAAALRRLSPPPQIILVAPSADGIAQSERHELADCLQRPVRTERLGLALSRALAGLAPASSTAQASPAVPPGDYIAVPERNETRAVPIADVVYLRADLKYVTIRTREREFLVQTTLAELDRRHPGRFVRVHRNTLVARAAIAGARVAVPEQPDAEPYQEVMLHGVPECLPVSRRQWREIRGIVESLASQPTIGRAARAGRRIP